MCKEKPCTDEYKDAAQGMTSLLVHRRASAGGRAIILGDPLSLASAIQL